MPSTSDRRRLESERLMKAMSHPLRAAILRVLNDRTASPAELARELDDHLHNVSYHTKRLEQLGCVELVKERHVRGAVEHFYRATTRFQAHGFFSTGGFVSVGGLISGLDG